MSMRKIVASSLLSGLLVLCNLSFATCTVTIHSAQQFVGNPGGDVGNAASEGMSAVTNPNPPPPGGSNVYTVAIHDMKYFPENGYVIGLSAGNMSYPEVQSISCQPLSQYSFNVVPSASWLNSLGDPNINYTFENHIYYTQSGLIYFDGHQWQSCSNITNPANPSQVYTTQSCPDGYVMCGNTPYCLDEKFRVLFYYH